VSLQPLRISRGCQFSAGLAAIVAVTSIFAGSATAVCSVLLANQADTSDPLTTKLILLSLTLVVCAVFLMAGHVLMRIALGRFRTGGSLSRFFRYQLAALGCGAGLGLGVSPAIFDAAPAWWVLGIAAGAALCAVSLLGFRSDRRTPPTRPPAPHIGLADGVVVDSWTGGSPQARAPQLTVVRFADETGRARWICHLVRRDSTTAGAMGQVQYDRRRPERILSFIPEPPTGTHMPLWRT
jgi:hypothetical protein